MKIQKPDHPKAKGELSEAIVSTMLLSLGLAPSKPLGDNAPYDLIIDSQGQLLKVQVKTGNLRNGTIVFNTTRSRLNTKRNYQRPYRRSEVDLFMVYCFELDEIYVVPNLDQKSKMVLRIESVKNGQKTKVNMASNFSLANFVSALEEIQGVERLKFGETFNGWQSRAKPHIGEGVET